MNLEIRPEAVEDQAGIGDVIQAAFARSDEVEIVDSLRTESEILISLVAKFENQIVGHICFSNLKIVTQTGEITAAALGPLAVLPELQNRGIGSALTKRGINECRSTKAKAIIVLGHENYYPRFGFDPKLTQSLEAPFSGDAFMALELEPGILDGCTGRVYYAKAFGV
jgi:putative acetyltransferase